MIIAVISEQENAGEIVVAACRFLALHRTSLIPVSKYKDVREEFIMSLSAFCFREGLSEWSLAADAKQIIEPRQKLPLNNISFWLALDQPGATRVRKIFARQGKSPDMYNGTFRNVNLLDPPIVPLPNIDTSPKFRRLMTKEYSSIYYWPANTHNEYKEILKERGPSTPEEKELFSWFSSLRNSLKPWRDTILKIVGDPYWDR